MFDKNFYKQVFDVTIESEKLAEFCKNMYEKKEFDTDNAFKKYYDVNCIIKAIQMYQDKKITDRYLSSWMCVYLWIIEGGYVVNSSDNTTFDELICYKITDTIDSLAFFDGSDWFDLDVYKQEFLFLDQLYKNQNDYQKLVFCFEEDEGCDEYVKGLMINDQEKSYTLIYTDLFESDVSGLQLKDKKEYDVQIEKLTSLGYNEIKTPWIINFEKVVQTIDE